MRMGRRSDGPAGPTSLLARLERGPRPPRPGPWLTAGDAALILAVFVLTRGTILLVAAATAAGDGADGGLAGALVRWDARWYVEIATLGYHREAGVWESGDGVNWPFFPALPILIAGLGAVTGLGGNEAGVAAAHALFLAGLFLVFFYVRDLFGRRFARIAVVAHALSPFSVHQSVPMSECLFAPLLVAALWLARREAHAGAALSAAVLSATRAVGVLVAAPLLAIAARRHGLGRLLVAAPGAERAVLMLACCGLGAAAFALHLHALTGDGLAFSHAQIAWAREPTWPWMTVYDALNPITRPPAALANAAFNLAVAGLALWLAWGLLRLRLGAEALFVVIVVTVALAAGQTTSLPRFVGAIPPLAVPAAWALRLAPAATRRAAAAAGFAIMAGFAALWCAESLYVM